MKILEVRKLPIFDVYLIRAKRHQDSRGYFCETFRKSSIQRHKDLPVRLQFSEFVQTNEVFSNANTFRGLHVNTIEPQGKLVRCISGRLIDFILDINPCSPTYKKIVAQELKADYSKNSQDWIWIPPGLAHGTLLTEDSLVEYYCTAEWKEKGDKSYSIFSEDIDWSLCNQDLKTESMDILLEPTLNISEKDKSAADIEAHDVELDWEEERNQYFKNYLK